MTRMTLNEHLKHDLIWWRNNIRTAFNHIKHDHLNLEIFTDASLTGWGACSKRGREHGFWSNEQKQHYTNFLEWQATFHGLKCFATDLSDSNIFIRCDNTTAISYINRMGSFQYPRLLFF